MRAALLRVASAGNKLRKAVACQGDAAEAVVGAQFEYEYGNGLFQYPADAAFTAGACLAAYSRVDNGIRQVEGVDAVRDEGGEGLIHAVQAVTGGEAIAEEEDGVFVCRGCGCGIGCWGRYGRWLFRLFAREG
jgi:hypothetical protein